MALNEMGERPNRLVNETSPYLLQHATNPVDWYPWGPEAISRAKNEDKPILLSIGYSACHWCHVMAHESFEDPEIAALMNELFVNIKVDREERPDIDAIYMEAVQAMTGHGGWPLTVFLTPEGKPFYGGTYFPPVQRHNMPGFPQVLRAIADAWQDRRRELVSAGDRMAEALSRSAVLHPAERPLSEDILDRAVQRLLRSFDRVEGGFGGAPKFPQPMNLDFLLQTYSHTRDPQVIQAAALTLTKMAQGGIYDQLGGGFHRYSTDGEWLVPHFEKMLYDNAQLVRTYLHAWQLTQDPLFRRIAEETLDYVLREMTSPEGGFYSTQDADSEGEEGRFFLWTPSEVERILGADDARLFCGYFDITTRGNFREGGPGVNILHIRRDLEVVAADLSVAPDRLAQVIEQGRTELIAARETRVRPGRDEKVLTEWNGLMLHAFAEAGAVLGRPDYIEAANRAATFLLTRLCAEGADGRTALRLLRTYKDGRAHINAFLEDYAAVALGLLALYRVTFEARWLKLVQALGETILESFRDADRPGFFQTSHDHEELVARRKDFVDSAVPSGNSLTADLFLHMGRLFGRDDIAAHANGILALMADGMAEQPGAFGRLLCALDFQLHPGYEIAIAGHPGSSDTRALLAEVYCRFLPTSILALQAPGAASGEALVPWLANRGLVGGLPAAYVCRDYTCGLPVVNPGALGRQLEQETSPGPGQVAEEN